MSKPNLRDIGREIVDEITDEEVDGYTDAALTIWANYPDDTRRDRMNRVLCFVAVIAVGEVLRRHGIRLGTWHDD